MVIVVVLLVAVVVVFLVRRRRKAMMLAGLRANRPVFSIEPPSRRMSGIDREVL